MRWSNVGWTHERCVSCSRGVMNFSFLISANMQNKKRLTACFCCDKEQQMSLQWPKQHPSTKAWHRRRCGCRRSVCPVWRAGLRSARASQSKQPRLHLILTFLRRRSTELTVTVKKRREPCGTSGRPQSRGEQEGQGPAAKHHGSVQRCAWEERTDVCSRLCCACERYNWIFQK